MASIADTPDGANRGGNIMLAGIIIQLGEFCTLLLICDLIRLHMPT